MSTAREVAHTLLQEYDWVLLDADTLTQLIIEKVPEDSKEETLRRQAQHQYTISLYEACRQTQNPERRECAYRDLYHYLYRAAYNRWPELAEDATQRALLLVYEQIEYCQKPDTFLAFALWKLRHAFKQEQRARRVLQEDEELTLEVARNQSPPISGKKQLLRQERVKMLVEALQNISDPRRRQAIALKYFADLKDAEIARRLGVSESYVRVLRHRGMKELRKSDRLRRYFDMLEDEDF